MEHKTAHPEDTPENNPLIRRVIKPDLSDNKSFPLSQPVLFRAANISTGAVTTSLVMRNLLNDMTGLAEALPSAIDQADWMNAFLFATGMWQIAEDYLHSDPLSLQRAEKAFEGLNHPLVTLPRGAVRVSRKIETRLYQRIPRYQQVLRWSIAWSGLVEALADAAIEMGPLPAEKQSLLAEQALALLSETEAFPARLKRKILKLPNCFRSFDQRPGDVQRLAERFMEQHPLRSQPVMVVGLRTSGSYLAPLLIRYLRRLGYTDVTLMTLRPGSDLLPSERAQIRRSTRQGALFTLIDDPPVTGRSIHEAARYLEREQVPAQSIVLLVPLFAGLDSLPPLLSIYECIVLPWKEWTVHDDITPQSIRAALSGFLLPGLEITEIEPISVLLNDNGRGHITALYRVQIRHVATGLVWQRDIFIKGAGLGYFGAHVLDAIQHLPSYFPAFYGLRGGLLFRAWMAEEEQLNHLSAEDLPAAARSMVSYIWDRHQKLPVPEDISLRRSGEMPAWEVASNLVGRVYGRAWKLARVPLVDPLMRQLLKSDNPSIVDGNMALSNWFYRPAEGQVKKVAFERSVFRNDVEYTSYDPVFDLACLAADLDMAVLEGKEWASTLLEVLRPEYEKLSGQPVDEERWLLYQMVRLYETQRALEFQRLQDLKRPLDFQRAPIVTQAHILRRAYSRALQRYFAACYFHDVAAHAQTLPYSASNICALDLDGVLETNYLRDASSRGFPALSPSSASALRSLAQHGYHSILVTGRSLPEVMERSTLYPVAGGVAEYGAVFYIPSSQEIQVLLSDDEQTALAILRRYFQAEPSIYLDPDYQYAVRACRLDATGRKVGLSADQVSAALQAIPPELPSIRAIPGEDQTDFMVERIDKAVGLRAMLLAFTNAAFTNAASASDPGKTVEDQPLALAVGDSLSDLPMLRMARRAAIPAHADPRLNQPGIRRYPKAYQAGLALAVANLLREECAHSRQAGSCVLCPAPALSEHARELLSLFAVQENGTRSMILGLFKQVKR